MKKLLLVLVIALVGCSKDEVNQCQCDKQTWQYNNSINDWYYTGENEFYSNDCENQGKIIDNENQQMEFRIFCY